MDLIFSNSIIKNIFKIDHILDQTNKLIVYLKLLF